MFSLSIHGYLGDFQLEALVSNAAMNMVCKCLFKTLFSILLGKYSEVGFAGC
jgi:hypothetical protein